jgi:hypothetical protein
VSLLPHTRLEQFFNFNFKVKIVENSFFKNTNSYSSWNENVVNDFNDAFLQYTKRQFFLPSTLIYLPTYMYKYLNFMMIVAH